MNSKNKRRIYLYYVENIFLVVIIISLFLAISLNKQNIEYLKREINKIPKNEENMIRKKAKYIAFVYVFASIYFAYVAYVDYVEEKIRERISNDKICFSDDNFTNVDYTIDTDTHTILEVTDEVYSLYNKKLSQLNHKA